MCALVSDGCCACKRERGRGLWNVPVSSPNGHLSWKWSYRPVSSCTEAHKAGQTNVGDMNVCIFIYAHASVPNAL